MIARHRRRPLALLFALSMAGLGGLLYLQSPTTPDAAKPQAAPAAVATTDELTTETTTAHDDPSSPQAGATPRPGAPSVAASTASALPPVGTALAESIDALRDAARQGDPDAACRLASEIARCAQARHLGVTQRIMESTTAQLARSEDQEQMIDSLAAAQERQVGFEEFCPPSAVIDAEPDWLEHAARAGHRRAQVLFALYRRERAEFPRVLREPGRVRMSFSQGSQRVSSYFAAHALRFLQEGLARHDPLALEGLIMVHDPSTNPQAESLIRLPDPERFAVLVRSFETLFPQAVSDPTSPFQVDDSLLSSAEAVLDALPPDHRATLLQQSEQLVRDWQRQTPNPTLAPLRPGLGEAAMLCDEGG